MNSSSKITTNHKSPRFTRMLHKKNSFRADSESDVLSVSDSDSITVSLRSTPAKVFASRIMESSKRNCCSICSIIPSLSNINCCAKHLTLLTTVLSPGIIYKTPSEMTHRSEYGSNFSSSKRCTRSRALKNRKRKRSETRQSLDRIEDEDLLSPNLERTSAPSIRSITNHRQSTDRLASSIRFKNVRNSQSPALIMNINNNNHIKTSPRQKRVFSPSPYVTRSKQRSVGTTSSDLCNSPRIFLNRIIHVKDEDEDFSSGNPSTTLNMAQATEQMLTEQNARPKIFLERVCFE